MSSGAVGFVCERKETQNKTTSATQISFITDQVLIITCEQMVLQRRLFQHSFKKQMILG